MFATTLRLYCIAVLIAGIAAAEDAGAYRLPLFRTPAAPSAAVELPPATKLRLLADGDFAPFSFATSTSEAAGLAVDLALASCETLKIACEIVLLPLDQLLPALTGGQGDAIIAGPRITETALETAIATRPYFRTLGRFAVQSGSQVATSSAASLTRKRIGAVKGTAHAAWLATYYKTAELLFFDSEREAQEALRTGAAEALFGDGLRTIYWIKGTGSRGCCKLLDGAYVDHDYFTRGLRFLFPAARPDLRAAFDVALDRLQDNGTTEKIFQRYVPLSPW